MFVMSTGQHTTLHTGKCTGRIIRLCTSVALDGLNLMEKQVACIVSILKHSDFSSFHPFEVRKNVTFIRFLMFNSQLIIQGRYVHRKAICLFLTQREEDMLQTSTHSWHRPLNERFSGKGQKGQEVL